jgi:JmjC domain
VNGYLTIDAAQFTRSFAHGSSAIRHRLAEHPLFTLDAIARLADRLPPDQVRRERGDLPLDDRGYVEVGTGPPSATILGIGSNNFRVSIREIQDDAEYGPLIASCHAEIRSLLGGREGGVARPSGYIFVTAPGGTTPMHFDGEHSFLLQIRGNKTVHTVPRVEPDEIQRELDRYYDGAPCRFDRMRATAETFPLGPGDGVYFPSFLPHWVATGNEVSISFSLPFYTQFSRRAEDVNRINKRLRRLGLSPRPPGRSEPIDQAKAAVLRSMRALRRRQDVTT